ncbi:MAG: hypothetical protein AAES65_20745 [Candidatus Thiodiazotropha sp. (ex. Lucinoma kazani)]
MLTGPRKITRHQDDESGSILYDIGDSTDDIYILFLGGGVSDRPRSGSGGGFTLRKGEVFGWAALLEDQPLRIAKAVCAGKIQFLFPRLNGKDVVEVLGSDPDSEKDVMRQLTTLITKHLTSSG